MLTVDDVDGGLLLVEADGQLTTEDYFELVTRLEWFANGRLSPVRLLMLLGPAFTGWPLDRLLEGLKLGSGASHPIARIAIIGPEQWRDWGARASGTGLVGETRFFGAAHRPDAEQWLRAPPDEGRPHPAAPTRPTARGNKR